MLISQTSYFYLFGMPSKLNILLGTKRLTEKILPEANERNNLLLDRMRSN